jgi:HK97 family phage prohead protease
MIIAVQGLATGFPFAVVFRPTGLGRPVRLVSLFLGRTGSLIRGLRLSAFVYSTLIIKSIAEDRREIVGLCSTPETDRIGDQVLPEGARFKTPLSLLWMHDHERPCGEVRSVRVTPAGLEITAALAQTSEPGKLAEFLDHVWQSVRMKLVRGLSIGFAPIKGEIEQIATGLRYKAWHLLEVSLVTVPANMSAGITQIRMIDQAARPAAPPSPPPKAKPPMKALHDLAETARGVSVSPRGRDFTRALIALAKAAAPDEAEEIAAARWGPRSRAVEVVRAITKTVVEGMATGNTSALVGVAAVEFFAAVAERSIVGRLAGLHRIPLQVRVLTGTGAVASWPGEGRNKPLTKMNFAQQTLSPSKVLGVTVCTQELLEHADIAAEAAIRADLTRAVVEALDEAFIDPANAGVLIGEAVAKPASITKGLSSVAAGSPSDFRADLKALVANFDGDLAAAVLVTTPTLALGASGADFPQLGVRGGVAAGFPVLTSRYVPAGVVALIDPTGIAYGEGAAETMVVRQGDVLMDAATGVMDIGGVGSPSAPTSAQLVSLWQTNCVVLVAGRTVNWGRVRAGSVALIPVLMPVDDPEHVTLRMCEELRKFVWDSCPTIPRSADYDHTTKSYPADPSGSCRHKAAYLQQHLGGQILFGRRTDQGPDPELHSVLAVRVGGGHLVVLDHDGIWPWPAFQKRWRPEPHEPAPPPEPKPAPARGGWYSHKR